MATTEVEPIVDRFIAAWERADVEELVDYFTEDAVIQWIPREPLVGKSAIREMLTAWVCDVVQLRAPVVHLQLSDGKTVMHERTDHYALRGREMVTPLVAVFQVENGQFTAWREYFDMSPLGGP